MSLNERLVEVIASHMIGLSSVLIFEMVGGSTSSGSLTERSFELVSCSAASMSLLGVKGEFDARRALPHVRLDVLDALDGNHRLLDRVDDLGFHHFRRRADPVAPRWSAPAASPPEAGSRRAERSRSRRRTSAPTSASRQRPDVGWRGRRGSWARSADGSRIVVQWIRGGI